MISEAERRKMEKKLLIGGRKKQKESAEFVKHREALFAGG